MILVNLKESLLLNKNSKESDDIEQNSLNAVIRNMNPISARKFILAIIEEKEEESPPVKELNKNEDKIEKPKEKKKTCVKLKKEEKLVNL